MKTTRYPAELALEVLRKDILPGIRHLCSTMNAGSDEACEAIKICGSLRRGLKEVGDIDIVYVNRYDHAAAIGELLPLPNQPLVDLAIEDMVRKGTLIYRQSKAGHETNGQWIKLLAHKETQIPVDFYAAKHESFWNLVLQRTGSKEHNITLANARRPGNHRSHLAKR